MILLVEMAIMMWNAPELIHYSDNKEEVAYDSGKIIGGMLLISAIFKGAKNAVNALKSDIYVQYMVTSVKLQMQGILSQSDTLTVMLRPLEAANPSKFVLSTAQTCRVNELSSFTLQPLPEKSAAY